MGYTATNKLQDMFDPRPLRKSVRRTAERCVEHLEDEVVKRTPVAKPPPGVSDTEFAGGRGRAPGTLKKSWRHSDVEETNTPAGVPRFSGEAYTEDPLGPLVEHPTRPHIIRPRPDRSPASVLATGKPRRAGTDPAARLRYVNRHGRIVFAAEVHHPGTEGSHMMRDSLAEVDGTWANTIGREEVERWAKEQAALVGT